MGIDASGADIHLGFAVPLRKLRKFQELGHKAILVVGDFTGMIGDPTQRSKTRTQLTESQVKNNIATYEEQLHKIVIPEKTEIVYNSQWLKKLTCKDIITLTSKYTVARMIERDDFQKRLQKGVPIYLHEILYPLLQGYDSIVLKADVELGGTDQKFNLIVTRELMRVYGLEPEVIITMPLLEGTDGKLKMSKSFGNYIAIKEPPNEMFGKIMSLPDELIIKYLELCTEAEPKEVEEMQKRLKAGENPKNLKAEVAKKIVSLYHSPEKATKAAKEFEEVFAQKKFPKDMPCIKIKTEKKIIDLLLEGGIIKSRSEGRRLIDQGGVYANNQRINSIEYTISPDKQRIVKVGKRKFLKVIPLK